MMFEATGRWRRILPLFVAVGSWGCGSARPVAQIETSIVSDQVAAVPAAMPPMGIGGQLPAGAGSLMAGLSAVGNARWDPDPIGQQVAPILGVGRLATAVDDNVELVLSGGAAPVGNEARAFGLAPSVLEGWVMRGHVGMRLFVPLKSAAHWSFSYDIGGGGHDLSAGRHHHGPRPQPRQRVRPDRSASCSPTSAGWCPISGPAPTCRCPC